MLYPVASRRSYYKPRVDEFNPETARYVVGTLKIATVCGMVKLPCSENSLYPGERQRVRMAVRMVPAAKSFVFIDHEAKSGGDGTLAKPFQNIQQAAGARARQDGD